MSRCPMKSQRRAPVMYHQRHVAEREAVEPAIEITRMVNESVRTGRVLSALSHTDQIRREASAQRLEMRNNVAPEIRGGGVAMEKNDRRAVVRGLYECDLAVEHSDAPPLVWIR